ncbi:MAG: matrixin family metalloprotease [archaeon]
MKKFLILGLFVMLVFSVSSAVAVKPDYVPKEIKEKAKVSLPSNAVEVSPGVFYLGKAVHKGKTVEGYAIIQYKKGFGKPGTECGNGFCEPSENSKSCPADCGGDNGEEGSNCYGFLARGAKWKTIEPYVVNTSNTQGLNASFILTNLALDINKWETAAGVDIIGNGSSTNEELEADLIEPDNKNEVYFGDVDDYGAIAITVVWGRFGGKPSQRELVEWDQIYDQVDFDWSASGDANKMDFENIATHELGHSVGMDDLYNVKCSEATMYGYADEGETNKRTLEAGDIIGVQELYS